MGNITFECSWRKGRTMKIALVFCYQDKSKQPLHLLDMCDVLYVWHTKELLTPVILKDSFCEFSAVQINYESHRTVVYDKRWYIMHRWGLVMSQGTWSRKAERKHTCMLSWSETWTCIIKPSIHLFNPWRTFLLWIKPEYWLVFLPSVN